jgi:hypothetical protein
VAQAFRRLGAQKVTTTWLRRERPSSVMTEGRFAGLRPLAMAILRDAQARGDVSLVREGCQTRFTVRVDVESAADSTDDSALGELLTDLETCRFALAEGASYRPTGLKYWKTARSRCPTRRRRRRPTGS